jgi:hypothetical protein
MASNKFFGAIGFAISTEIRPGVWDDVIHEREYRGDVVRNTRRLEAGEKVNSDLAVDNSISIVADPYASEHFFAMRYISWAGTLWTVTTVEVQSPRLVLRLGGVYNGPLVTPDAP